MANGRNGYAWNKKEQGRKLRGDMFMIQQITIMVSRQRSAQVYWH